MIHREATIKYKGYDPKDLKPKSHKRVCCICDRCGKIRWLEFVSYNDLCKSCSKSGKNHPMYNKHHNEETKEKISNSRKNKLIGDDNPSKRLKVREKISESKMGVKRGLFSNIWRINMSVSQQGITIEEWKGFKQFEVYPKEFWDIKKYIRDKYSNCDYLTGIHKDICNPNRELDVHHIDYNKNNSDEDNLIPLCRLKHIMTNNNRSFWNKLFIYSLKYDEEYYRNNDFDIFKNLNGDR